MSQSPRALAIDIDGTLINSNKQITPFTRTEIQRVAALGVHVFLVTARGPQSASVIEQRLGVASSFASFGGALVWARREDGTFAVLRETPLLDSAVEGVLRHVTSGSVHTGIYTRDRWFVDALSYWGLREARNTAVWPHVADIDINLAREVGPLFKIMFRGEREELADIASSLKHVVDETYIHQSGKVLEIFAAGAIKLPAVRELSEFHGVSLGEVAAFGDSASDLGMIEGAGIGVLMSNASDDLAVSSRVLRTLSNDEDGVGMAIRLLFPTDAPFDP